MGHENVGLYSFVRSALSTQWPQSFSSLRNLVRTYFQQLNCTKSCNNFPYGSLWKAIQLRVGTNNSTGT